MKKVMDNIGKVLIAIGALCGGLLLAAIHSPELFDSKITFSEVTQIINTLIQVFTCQG